MRRFLSACAGVVVVSIASSSSADMVAYWHFNGLLPNPDTATGIAADLGSGTLLADGSFGSSLWASTASNPQLTAFTGFTNNAMSGVAAGNAVGFSNSSSNSAGSSNGFSAVLKLNLAEWESVSLSYASRGSGSGFGFTTQTWSWSTDGVNYTTLTTFTGANAAPVVVRDLGSLAMLDHASDAFLKITFDGATASNGHNRIDNVLVQGTYAPVPAPAAAALLALTAAFRRRRGR